MNMLKALVLGGIILSLTTTWSSGQTFDETAIQLSRKISELDIKDGGSGLKKCEPVKSVLVCTFDDKGFQRTVKSFKELNLVNGRFTLKSALFLTPANGKVESVRLLGDRSDPMNLLHSVGSVASVVRALNPSIDNDKVQKILRDFHLNKGDSDPGITAPQTVIESGFAGTCQQALSKISTKIDCTFVPRS
jgi:hypothetical protein